MWRVIAFKTQGVVYTFSGFSLLGAYRIAMQALSVAQQKLLIHMS